MNTQTLLKRYLVQEVSNNIAFFPSRKCLIVHPIDINPSTYSIATLHGCGLEGTNLAIASGKLLKKKLQERQNGDFTWLLTPEEFLSRIDTEPLLEKQCYLFFNLRICIYKSVRI